MKITDELVGWYQKEIEELYHDRMNETPTGKSLFQDTRFNSFEKGLMNIGNITGPEQEELDWCLRNAVLDASETLVVTELKRVGYLHQTEEEEFTFTFTESNVDEDEKTVYIELRDKIRFHIEIAASHFKDIDYVRNSLNSSINNIPILRAS